MSYTLDRAAQQRLETYCEQLGGLLHNDKQRASFAMYTMGLLGDAERKSVEPIAAKACPYPAEVDAVHQRLLHFIGVAPWDDHALRLHAARHVLEALPEGQRVERSIIDDTGFLKQGTHSVGVQRQYTGSAGKVTNCQLGVSLTAATEQVHFPVDMELYLPTSWTDDPARRQEARIPDDVLFKTKPELALGMLQRARAAGLPLGMVLADSAFGVCGHFRAGVRQMDLDYALGIHRTTKVQCVSEMGISPCASSVADLAQRMGRRAYRRIAWREGTRKRLQSRFAFNRVVVANRHPDEPLEEMWLVSEWPKDQPQPTHFFLCTLGKHVTHKELVRLIKERYRTEQVYQELKGELGLDHYEGRRYPGWHHHITVALCCYAFVVAERLRLFPPSAAWAYQADPLLRAA